MKKRRSLPDLKLRKVPNNVEGCVIAKDFAEI